LHGRTRRVRRHWPLEEARANGWDGEVLALETTLQAFADKKAQVERIRLVTGPPAGSSDSKQTVWLTIGPPPVIQERADEHHAVVSRPKG
jgi:hypothetical protein